MSPSLPTTARTKKSRKRQTKVLKEGLRRNLVAYALAGAGIAALSPEATAEIIYTQVYRTFHGSGSGTIPIDLDNDGTTDFYLSWSANGGVGNASEWVRPANVANNDPN
jgi:hypothetical protein